MAPFKSEAQRRRFAEMVKQGKLDQKTFDEWNSTTPANLPERVGEHPKSPGLVRAIKPRKARKPRR